MNKDNKSQFNEAELEKDSDNSSDVYFIYSLILYSRMNLMLFWRRKEEANSWIFGRGLKAVSLT